MFNSKINLLLLILSICLFFSMSCIHATDTDSIMADNQSSVASDDVINILQNATVDETPNLDTCNMTKDPVDVVVNHNHHHINKTYFTHNLSVYDFNIGSHHDYKIPHDNSDFKIKQNHDWIMFDYKIQKYTIESEFSPDCAKAMAKIGKIRTNTDIATHLHLNEDCSFCNGGQLNKVTKESEFCCCGKENCHHHVINECIGNILGTGNHEDDNFACLCNVYTQIKVINNVVVKSPNREEEENINDVLISEYIHILNQTGDVNVIRGFYWHSNIDLCDNLTNSAYGMFSQFSHIGLDIGSLLSQDLDIKDYNLEYYIFTNPDIIIERADITAKANTLIFNSYINHCIKTFNNSFLTDYQILWAFKHIIEYNYASLNITTFLLPVSLKCEIDYFYNGHAENLDDNHLLSGDESAPAIIFVLEDLKKCFV